MHGLLVWDIIKIFSVSACLHVDYIIMQNYPRLSSLALASTAAFRRRHLSPFEVTIPVIGVSPAVIYVVPAVVRRNTGGPDVTGVILGLVPGDAAPASRGFASLLLLAAAAEEGFVVYALGVDAFVVAGRRTERF